MARTTKATRAAPPPAAAAGKKARSAASAAEPVAKAGRQPAARKAAAAVAAPAPTPAPKLGVKELRALVETLEQANAKLRAKGRESNKAAKAATARIAELEQQVAQSERSAVAQPVPAKRSAKQKPAAPVSGKRQQRGTDPGNAVPPGAVVGELTPLDGEAETATDNLEAHPGPR